MEQCPCGSGQAYKDCCEPIISEISTAQTAEQLMRARYSAYATGAVKFILSSTHPDRHEECDERAIKSWSENSQWHGLEIVSTEKGGPEDSKGKVEFIANFTENRINKSLHETGTFEKINGKWVYLDGTVHPAKPFIRTEEKVNRNDPCPCGSGKKFKKCCF
ncbi:hypothetical protein CHISP_1532 [Chitinispirillum alkaliphilum]|nr:hypothetical protein CHISP_1532 [Chitinispirillum alkaliphilum]